MAKFNRLLCTSLLLILLIQVSPGDCSLYQGQKTQKREGGTFVADCSPNYRLRTGEEINIYNVHWYKETKYRPLERIESDTNRITVSIEWNGKGYIKRLTIKDLDQSDGTSYKCQSGDLWLYSVHLEVKPSFAPSVHDIIPFLPLTHGRSVLAREGDESVSLHCGVDLTRIDARQIQRIEWMMYNVDSKMWELLYQNDPLNTKLTLERKQDDEKSTVTLTIGQLQPGDEGDYKCVVYTENMGLGESFMQLRLHPELNDSDPINVPLLEIIEPEPKAVGESIALNCGVDPDKMNVENIRQIKWYRKGSEEFWTEIKNDMGGIRLTPFTHYSSTYNVELDIDRLEKSHEGMYACQVFTHYKDCAYYYTSIKIVPQRKEQFY